MNTTGKILIALATGVAAGTILGVLFAPEKGSETRKKISDTGKKITEQGKKIADDMKDKFHKSKERFNDLKEDIEQTVKEKAGEFA